MGFNISGIAISKNFEKNLDELQSAFGWKIEKQEEIFFEQASENWKEEDLCDIYFTDNGTLIFIDMGRCIEPFKIGENNVLTFAYSATSMAFNLNYCEGAELKRTIMEVEGQRLADEGEKLEIENKSEDISENIFEQIGVVLGKSFWEIQSDERAVRFLFK